MLPSRQRDTGLLGESQVGRLASNTAHILYKSFVEGVRSRPRDYVGRDSILVEPVPGSDGIQSWHLNRKRS